MTVERIENGKLRYKYREPNGSETVYRQDQILHAPVMSGDGVTGMIPVELAKDAVALARACELHGASYFGNGAVPASYSNRSAVRTRSGSALRDNWERMHRGAEDHTEPLCLRGRP